MTEIQSKVTDIVEQRAIYKNVPSSYLIVKRIFDFTVSLISLLILIPLFIIIAVLIKLDSPGPIFFIQKRSGFKGKVFNMYKFRSMVSDAEQQLEKLKSKNEANGCIFKIKNDPRVTRVGRIIRKTSIDELPQLINVLKGEMSIVGPRPPIVNEVKKYDPWHHLKLSVKPGITGLWQVTGRGNIDFEEMCRLDLKYIRERSVMYDLKIILRTIPVLLGDSRAC